MREEEHTIIACQKLLLDLDSDTAAVDGTVYELTQREFEVLRELLTSQGRIMTRQNLLDQLWRYDFYGDEQVAFAHIKNLRKSLALTIFRQSEGQGTKLIRKVKSSLFA